jgi:molybdopterin molybdotransferase
MLLFEQALEIILGQDFNQKAERVPFQDSLHRVLAEDIYADVDMPPFDKSAVDGYACRKEDIFTDEQMIASLPYKVSPRTLIFIETIPAGYVPQKTIGPGQCSKIMTGAILPQGADCVVMVEDTKPAGENNILITSKKPATNICFQAEDVRKGDRILVQGTLLKPSQIAILASVGAVNPLVSVLPRVAIISTGDELVEPGNYPEKSKIRNSNAYQLLAQIKEVPAVGIYCGIASDTPESLSEIISTAFKNSDVVILTGGVSMGEYDYVPAVMKELQVEILFKSIAIQPGRPTVFGKRGDQYIFGLPGNPVSSFVLFELMIKPFLRKMTGNNDMPALFKLPMGLKYSRAKSGRKSMIPVEIRDGKVFPLEYHGSAHIHSYTRANGLISVEIGTVEIKEGEFVDVRPI